MVIVEIIVINYTNEFGAVGYFVLYWITSRNLNEWDSKRKLTTEYRAGKEI